MHGDTSPTVGGNPYASSTQHELVTLSLQLRPSVRAIANRVLNRQKLRFMSFIARQYRSMTLAHTPRHRSKRRAQGKFIGSSESVGVARLRLATTEESRQDIPACG